MKWQIAVPLILVVAFLARRYVRTGPPPEVPRYGAPVTGYGHGAATPGGQVPDLRGRHGPYIRIDRANEVAAQARSLGYNASVVYLGTLENREYAVDVY